MSHCDKEHIGVVEEYRANAEAWEGVPNFAEMWVFGSKPDWDSSLIGPRKVPTTPIRWSKAREARLARESFDDNEGEAAKPTGSQCAWA